MTVQQILDEIRPLGLDSYKRTMMNHGVPEPIFGVKIEDLKKIQKRIKKDHQLALDLWDTGVYDARYLAGLIADDLRMTKPQLKKWATQADCFGLREWTVPWVAASGKFGRELGLEWIESKKEGIASTGWATLSSLVSIKPDAELDLEEWKGLLDRVAEKIHSQPDRVRDVMNRFVIAVGSYCLPLKEKALEAAARIGKVDVDMGGTACKVPDAAEYIAKVEARGSLGKKRKSAKC